MLTYLQQTFTCVLQVNFVDLMCIFGRIRPHQINKEEVCKMNTSSLFPVVFGLLLAKKNNKKKLQQK